jgi:hypothetical protein
MKAMFFDLKMEKLIYSILFLFLIGKAMREKRAGNEILSHKIAAMAYVGTWECVQANGDKILKQPGRQPVFADFWDFKVGKTYWISAKLVPLRIEMYLVKQKFLDFTHYLEIEEVPRPQ